MRIQTLICAINIIIRSICLYTNEGTGHIRIAHNIIPVFDIRTRKLAKTNERTGHIRIAHNGIPVFDIRTRKLAKTRHIGQCCLFAILSTEEMRVSYNIAYNGGKARQFRIL